MSTLIYSLINLIYLTTGRRLYALKRCLEVAIDAALSELVPLIEAAIAHDTRTVVLEDAWCRSKSISTARGVSFDLDNKIDAILGYIFSKVSGNLSLFEPDHPIVVASELIISQVFPEGVHSIITLPFEEQLIRNQSIIDRLTGDLGDAVAVTNIGPYVARLESLNNEFRAELGRSASREISYDELEAARDKGNLLVREIVAVIIGTFHRDSDEDSETRQALLQPFLEQADRVRRARKGRRPPRDVDPETGDEVLGDENAA
jgi:hypothetical protein